MSRKSEKQTRRVVEFGPFTIGVVEHVGKRQFTYSLFLDAPGTKPRRSFASGKAAENEMCREWRARIEMQGRDDGVRSQIAAHEAASRDLKAKRAALLEIEDRTLADALTEASLADLTDALVTEFTSLTKRVNWGEKDTCCSKLWKATKETMQGQITETELREMCKDAGIDLLDDEEKFAEKCALHATAHPALEELAWAMRARSSEDRDYALKRAFACMREDSLTSTLI